MTGFAFVSDMASFTLATLAIVVMLFAVAWTLANIVAQLKLLNETFTEILKDIRARDYERRSAKGS